MSRDAWLSLHILGVVLFLGNIIVTMAWKVFADRTKGASVVAYAQRLVTTTDIAFTATGVVLIVVSGQVMAGDFGGVFGGPAWLTIGWSLFIASGVIWVAANKSGSNLDLKAVRAWAASNKIELSSRGGAPANVIEQYRAAGN